MTNKQYSISLIQGRKSAGKTSVALRLALDAAGAGKFSLIIGNREKIEQLFKPTLSPVFSQCGNYVSLLSNIHLSYADQKDSIIEIMAGVQFFRKPPSVIVVDDLSTLIDPLHTRSRNDIEYLQQVLLVISHLQDLGAFMCSPDNFVQLVLTDSCQESDYLTLLSRCVDHQVHIAYNESTGIVECRDHSGNYIGYDSLKTLLGMDAM